MRILEKFFDNQKMLTFLEAEFEKGKKPIGIITPYLAQAELIKRELINRNWGKKIDPEKIIHIGSVDSYQGKENRIIIFSLTRNNAEGIVGFTEDKNRLNVALSRAMDRLIIVGAKPFWSEKSGLINKILNYIIEADDSSAQVIDAGDLK